MHDQVEHVARAFHAVEHTGTWEEASETAKEEFRQLAREAIDRLKGPTDEIRSIVISAIALQKTSAGELEHWMGPKSGHHFWIRCSRAGSARERSWAS